MCYKRRDEKLSFYHWKYGYKSYLPQPYTFLSEGLVVRLLPASIIVSNKSCHVNNFWFSSDNFFSWSDDIFLFSTRWRHQMETFSALLALYVGNSPVTGEFPSQSRWRGALGFSLICAWIDGWVNNPEAGDFRRHRAEYDVIAVNYRPVANLCDNSLCQHISPQFLQCQDSLTVGEVRDSWLWWMLHTA